MKHYSPGTHTDSNPGPGKEVDGGFVDNEISGANWTTDQGTVNEANTGDQKAEDQIDSDYTYSMQPPNPSIPAPGKALEIQPDGTGKQIVATQISNISPSGHGYGTTTENQINGDFKGENQISPKQIEDESKYQQVELPVEKDLDHWFSEGGKQKMAVNDQVASSDLVVDNKDGTVYRFMKFTMNVAGSVRFDVGETPSDAILIEGPTGFDRTNFYVSAPQDTTSANTTFVKVDNTLNNPIGEYKMLVIHRGRNAAAL